MSIAGPILKLAKSREYEISSFTDLARMNLYHSDVEKLIKVESNRLKMKFYITC